MGIDTEGDHQAVISDLGVESAHRLLEDIISQVCRQKALFSLIHILHTPNKISIRSLVMTACYWSLLFFGSFVTKDQSTNTSILNVWKVQRPQRIQVWTPGHSKQSGQHAKRTQDLKKGTAGGIQSQSNIVKLQTGQPWDRRNTYIPLQIQSLEIDNFPVSGLRKTAYCSPGPSAMNRSMGPSPLLWLALAPNT